MINVGVSIDFFVNSQEWTFCASALKVDQKIIGIDIESQASKKNDIFTV